MLSPVRKMNHKQAIRVLASQDSMQLRIVHDADAQALLEDVDFQEQWQRLYERCPWSTPFQSHTFVETWYRCYSAAFRPLIVIGRSSGGELAGVLPLGIAVDGGQLVVAGGDQCEYHGWLTSQADCAEFMRLALKEVGRWSSARRLEFRYLPPGISLDWLSSLASSGPDTELTTYVAPVLRLDEPGVDSFIQMGKTNRSYWNRLARQGHLEFKQIQDADALAKVLDEIITQYDMKMAATYEATPFRSDPRKRPFHLALMRAGLLHLTVMTLDKRVIASETCLCDRHTVHLGFASFSPVHGQCSPGTLHIHMLAEHLQKQGYRVMDLTPGDDRWKARFANDHRTVQGLSVRFRGSRLWRETYGAVKKVERRLTDRSAALARVIRVAKAARRWREFGARLPAAASQFYDYRELHIYSLDTHEECDAERDDAVRRNCLDDAFGLETTGRRRLVQSLRSTWQKLLAGHQMYTYVRDGRLLWQGWSVFSKKVQCLPEIDAHHLWPANSVVLHGFWTRPGEAPNAMLLRCLPQMLHDVSLNDHVKTVLIAAPREGLTSLRGIEELGFRHLEAVFGRTILGRSRRWRRGTMAAAKSVENSVQIEANYASPA